LKSTSSAPVAVSAPWRDAFGSRVDLERYGSNAIGLFALALKFGVDDLDTLAADAIVDGGNDKKLDIIYVDEEKRVAAVIQAYSATSPKPEAPANKASDLNTAAAWVLSTPQDQLPAQIKAQTVKLREAIRNGALDTLHIWYTHNCSQSQNFRNELSTVEHTVKAALQTSFPSNTLQVSVMEVGDAQFASWYSEIQSPILVHDEFTFNCPEGFLTKGKTWTAYVTSISAAELYDAYKQHSSALFSANVRDYLGSRASGSNINNGIKKTADENPENFWVYNNGITAVTNKLECIAANGGAVARLKVTGLSIVNGAQTTGAIGALTTKPSLKARIPARFVQTDDADLIQEIVRYNNSQNQITASDFRSTDRTQKRLKEEWKGLAQTDTMNLVFLQKHGDRNVWHPETSIYT
jgi:AIPR protein